MLADPALVSTTMFITKKWWVKIPTKFNREKNNEIVSPIITTKLANCSAFFILHYCRTACLVAPHAIASGRCRPISHHLFLIRSQRENSWLILGALSAAVRRQLCFAFSHHSVVEKFDTGPVNAYCLVSKSHRKKRRLASM